MGLFSLFSGSGTTRDADVRLITQSAIAAWSQLAVLPAAGLLAPPAGGVAEEISRERAALMRVAPIASNALHLDAIGGGSFAGGSGSFTGGSGSGGGYGAAAAEGAGARRSSASGSGGYGSAAGGSPRSAGAGAGGSPRASSGGSGGGGYGEAGGRRQSGSGGGLLDLSLDDLLAMRARELKKLLSDQGIDSQDLFEKEALAQRAYEMCCRR
jgi:hypothetical protein